MARFWSRFFVPARWARRRLDWRLLPRTVRPCLGHFVASDTSRFGSQLDADVLALESTKVPMRFKLKSREPFTFAERVRRQGS